LFPVASLIRPFEAVALTTGKAPVSSSYRTGVTAFCLLGESALLHFEPSFAAGTVQRLI